MQQHEKFELTVTAIIFDEEGRVLITQRSFDKKRFPGKWTVPGGHVELCDAQALVSNRDGVAYGILERALNREVKEETGLKVKNVKYVTSMVLDNAQAVVISMKGDLAGGEFQPNSEIIGHAWMTLTDLKSFEDQGLLIDGIYNEIVEAAYSEKEK